jgi:hypothetical protein
MPRERLMFMRAGTCYTLYVLMEDLEQSGDVEGWHFWPATQEDARRALGFYVEEGDEED